MRILMVIALLVGLGGRASAFSETDRAAVQNVIEQQLGAFLRDDAATAYSFASPGIKEMFPTEEIFMRMVREGYAPVYRSRSHSFGELKETAAGLTQSLDIIDAAGEFWTATYTLQQQPDGSWKITACHLQKKPGESV
jgi:hypothetical protein